MQTVERRGRRVSEREHAARACRAAALKARGVSNRAIARELGCSIAYVPGYLDRAGAPRGYSTHDFGPAGEVAGGRLSLVRASKRFGLALPVLRDAAKAGRVRCTIFEGVGGGCAYLFNEAELEADLAVLPKCNFDGCERRVLGNSGGCEEHGHVLATRGRKWPSWFGYKVSLAVKGKPRPYASERLRKNPEARFALRMGRWGMKSVAHAKRAADALARDLRRRRGGAPPKDELHGRWLAMSEGKDAELERLLEIDESRNGDRVRLIVLLDWQRYEHDWPRHKWPAHPGDPESLQRALVDGACRRVRAGIKSAREKSLQIRVKKLALS